MVIAGKLLVVGLGVIRTSYRPGGQPLVREGDISLVLERIDLGELCRVQLLVVVEGESRLGKEKVGNSEDDLLLAVFAHLGLVLLHPGRSHGSVGTSYLVKIII